ncbi:uncharacterized protein LOC134528021 [Bacillus rossius redtenbacheri]|uniref:uncharacterized protein LOC134528021 n=1 Tax=Bacillus rossius redtenbacheri TaxID=93214 RepID=UPI002FDD55CF
MKWDVHIPNLLYCLRRRTNAATGYLPAQLVQGQNLALPGECQVFVAATEGELGEAFRTELSVMREQARQHQEAYIRKTMPHHLSSKAKDFKAGFAPKWSEPRQVIRKFGPTTYLVQMPSGRPAKIHRDDLRQAGDQPESRMTGPQVNISLTNSSFMVSVTEPDSEGRESDESGSFKGRRYPPRRRQAPEQPG